LPADGSRESCQLPKFFFVCSYNLVKAPNFSYLLTNMTDQVMLKIYTLTGRLVSQFDILDGFAGYNEFS